MPKRDNSPTTTEEKMDVIIEYLHKMDKRDNLRTWGAFFRSILGLIPLVFFIWSIWYFYYHGDEVLAKIAKQAAEQAAAVTERSAEGVLKQLQDILPEGASIR